MLISYPETCYLYFFFIGNVAHFLLIICKMWYGMNNAAHVSNSRVRTVKDDLVTEFYRKSIHLLIGIVPIAASYQFQLTVFTLIAGTLCYTFAELARLSGRDVYIISGVTRAASRVRDRKPICYGTGYPLPRSPSWH